MKIILAASFFLYSLLGLAQTTLPRYDEQNKIPLNEVSAYKEALRNEFNRLAIFECEKNGVMLEYYVTAEEKDIDANWYLFEDKQPLIVYFGMTNTYGNNYNPIEIVITTSPDFREIIKIESAIYYVKNDTRVNVGTLKDPKFIDEKIVKVVSKAICFEK